MYGHMIKNNRSYNDVMGMGKPSFCKCLIMKKPSQFFVMVHYKGLAVKRKKNQCHHDVMCMLEEHIIFEYVKENY